MSESELALLDKNEKLVSVDSGQFRTLTDTAHFEHIWRVANYYAKSDMLPVHFKDKAENVLVCMEMAVRLEVSPMMLMQNTYIIKGKPGMEAKLAIALINSSGLFDSPLSYEIAGSAKTADLKCRAYTYKNKDRIDGPWVTWEMVKAEGWLDKQGSKWKTMPDLMIQYRAATFFGRLKCPERLMGMQTTEELRDVKDEKVSKIQAAIVKAKELPEVTKTPVESETKKTDTEPQKKEEPPAKDSVQDKKEPSDEEELVRQRRIEMTNIALRFQKIKKVPVYREILKSHGFEDSTKVESLDAADAIIEDLKKRIGEIESEKN